MCIFSVRLPRESDVWVQICKNCYDPCDVATPRQMLLFPASSQPEKSDRWNYDTLLVKTSFYNLQHG